MKKQLVAISLAALLATSSLAPSFAEAKTTSHTVKSGDTLYQIARVHDVSVNELLAWNGLKSSVIRIGQTLTIQNKTVPVTPNQPTKPTENTSTYTVKKGDTLSKIAKANGVSVNNVKSWNGLKNDVIYIGQKLTLKKVDPVKPVTPPKENTEKPTESTVIYTVKSGDTLSKISKHYGVTVAQLKQWNGLKNDTIGIGQKLTVKKEKVESTPVKETPIPKTIKDETPPMPSSAPVYPSEGVKGIYVTEYNVANNTKFNQLLGLIERTELNTMVINVKNDDGRVTYDSNSEAVNAYKVETNVLKNTKTLMDNLQKKKVYTVARIVTFKDPYMAQKNKNWAMKKKNGDLFYLDGAYWIDPYNKEYWTYVVNIAKEAASLGFDEIQFDYVRFPSNRNNQVDSVVKFNNPTNQTKEAIIPEFLTYAKKELEPYGVKVSADVFAWAMAVNDDAGIGQKWENMTQVVDITSPMIYPSHYSAGNLGVKDPIRQPYDIVKASIDRALKRETVLKNQNKSVADMRPWFQDFSQHGVTYGTDKVKAQIKAAKELGVNEYLMWNAQNNYTESAYKK